jgi:glycosyltransferase involved in cell wall biosynthesis
MAQARASLRIVMPVHNAERYLESAVASVLEDLPADGELVVVDDGSTDGSPRLIAQAAAQDPRVRVLTNPAATGVSRALNSGIELTGCPEFVGVAEHDDLVVKGRFAEQVAALRADPRLGAVSGEGRYLGPSGRIAGRVSVGPRSTAEFETMKQDARELLIPHPAVTYRREAVVGAGLYDPGFDSAQDLELINRLVYQYGWRVRTVASQHVLYRIHDSSMSFSHISAQRMMTRYIRYRNRAQLDGHEWQDYATWQEQNAPDLRTRWTWYRKDQGALHYRQAGLAWLNRRPLAFLGHVAAAAVLHPRWVVAKVRVAVGR